MTLKPPYHIAFVISSFGQGGMEMRLADVVNGLDKSLWNPHIYAFYDHLAMHSVVPTERLHIPLARLRPDPSLIPRLAQVFRKEGTVIAWMLGQGAADLWGRSAAWLAGVPIRILSIHDLFPLPRYTHWLPAPDLFVTNSRYAMRFLMDQGIPAPRIEVLYNGIDIARYAPGPDQRTTLWNIPPDRPVILQVGRLEPGIKGQDVVLRAVAPLMNRPNPPLTVFVGEGIFSEREKLEKLRDALGLGEQVRFMGLRDDIPTLLRSADILVMASRTESSPNVILEAGACEVPVIAADVGGASELMIEGKTGLLIPSDDPTTLTQQLAYLLDDASRRYQMGRHARSHIQQYFSVQTMLERRAAIFEALLHQKHLI